MADKTVVVICKLQHCALMQGNACLMMDELVTVIEIESTVLCKTRKKSPGVPKQMKQNQSYKRSESRQIIIMHGASCQQ